jgi:ribonuclease VapC
VLSSENWAEVLQKSVSAGVMVEGLREDLQALWLALEPFSAADADTVAMLSPPTPTRGLSLADRACLSLALQLGLPVLTGDRIWAELALPLQIQLLR